ncbi:unnamed protein product [Urochloa humidicola]
MDGFSWLVALGFGLLTFNTGMVIYRSQGDPEYVVFAVLSYVKLVALFVCLRLYESLDPGSLRRETLRVAIWVLTTLLIAMYFFYMAEGSLLTSLPSVTQAFVMAATSGHTGLCFLTCRYVQI